MKSTIRFLVLLSSTVILVSVANAETPQTSTPAQAPAMDKTILTDVQLQKLDKDMASYGIPFTFNKAATDALGLTRNNDTLTIRELVMDTKNPLKKHIFARIPDGDGFIFLVAVVGSGRTYVTDSNQQLVAAVLASRTTTPVAIPVAQAQQELKDELAFWSKVADSR